MRWVNTGYSISFRCRTAVVLDSAGILFFTTGANANCALIVFICYHIVGMWKSLLACQPLCPTWVCHLLMCHCRQSGTSVTRVGACTQTGPATAETQPGAWIGLQLLPKITGSYCPDDSNRHPTGVWMVTCFWFFPPAHWKSRFYSNAFKNIWTLAWPCHCGLLIVPSLFQISDPSLLHIMSQWAAEICQGSDLPVCAPEHPLWITEWEGRALCSSLTCVLLLCLPWYLSCYQCCVHTNCKSLFQANIQISTLRLILMQI